MNVSQQIDGIVAYLDRFEQPGFLFGFWTKEPSTLPLFTLSDECDRFAEDLHKYGWVSPFDWTEWQGEAAKYLDDPSMINSADVETIRNLFTTHVRKDRFCEGHLAEMLKSGHISALLRRLKTIRESEHV